MNELKAIMEKNRAEREELASILQTMAYQLKNGKTSLDVDMAFFTRKDGGVDMSVSYTRCNSPFVLFDPSPYANRMEVNDND